MAYTIYIGGGTWNDVKVFANGDGTGQFIGECWTPAIGRIEAIREYLTEAGTLPLGGPSLDSQGTNPNDPDGTGLIGFSGYAAQGVPAGTLRTKLEMLYDFVTSLDTDKLDLLGGTVTGPVLFSGSTARVRHRSVSNLTNADSTFGPTADVFVTYSAIGAGVTRTYTVNTSTAPALLDGDEIRIINRGTSNATAQIVIAQEGGSVLGTFTAGNDYGWMVIGFDPTTNNAAPTAFVKSFGSANGTITLTNPYPLP